MRLFSFLNRKNESENAAISMLPVLNPADQSEEEVNSVMTTPKPESHENKPLTVSYATGWPIDIIYGYLHKNYEEKGFNDSMVKSDLAFREHEHEHHQEQDPDGIPRNQSELRCDEEEH